MHDELHPDWEELVAFENGRIADATWRKVATHLLQCNACSDSLEAVPKDDFLIVLRSLGEEVSTVDPNLEALGM